MTQELYAPMATDGYKLDHRRQYPPNTSFVYSNFTARSAKLSNLPEKAHDNKVIFYGMSQFIQRFIVEFWGEKFFKVDFDLVSKDYKNHLDAYLGPNEIGVDHLKKLHDMQYMPVCIKALPEGTRVPIQVPCFTIENTSPDFFWVTNYLETLLSCEMWKPMTSATTAFAYRKLIDKYCDETGGNKDFVPYQGHDFSFRGMSGFNDACVSGSAHLTSFYGSDTVPAVPFIEKYYQGASCDVIAMSIPATEHSVMCMGTKTAEIDTFDRFISELYPSGPVSIVSDTWDYWKALTEYTVELKDKILSRDGKTVFRPDSGDPVRIICGDEIPVMNGKDYDDFLGYAKYYIQSKVYEETAFAKEGPSQEKILVQWNDDYYSVLANIEWDRYDKQFYHIDGVVIESVEKVELTPQQKGSVEVLWDIFGGTTTDKGYKTLDSHVGLIYGDSITYERCEEILRRLQKKGFSSDNIVFGIGSFSYQYVTRDTYGMAMKATFGIVDNEERAIFKDPKTGSGKKSAKGLLAVVDGEEGLELIQNLSLEEYTTGIEGNKLRIVYANGCHVIKPTFEEIRKRIYNS